MSCVILKEFVMEWWGWLIIVVVVLIVLGGGFLALQARRRRGGVIVDPARPGQVGPAGTNGKDGTL
jgi:hypothetical protein